MVVRPLSLSASIMRWKPSVSSCSASAAGCALTAASAIESLPQNSFRLRMFFSKNRFPLFRNMRLIKIRGMARDVIGKAEGVRAHELFGTLGCACFKSLDDIQVVANRTVGAILFADGLAADHAHVGEQILCQIDEHGVAAHADDRLVE